MLFPWRYRSAASYAEERERQHEGWKSRLLILEALVAAASRRPEVIEAITTSEDPHEAHERLVGLLGISDLQAHAVLDLQLRNLTERDLVRFTGDRDEVLRELDAWDPDLVVDGPRWIRLRRGWGGYDVR